MKSKTIHAGVAESGIALDFFLSSKKEKTRLKRKNFLGKNLETKEREK